MSVEMKAPSRENGMTTFAVFGLAFQVVMLIMYGTLFRYKNGVQEINGMKTLDGGVGFYYGMYMDVHVMVFAGFGFLMTFLGRHGFGSVGLNFMISAYVIQWSILCNGLFHKWWTPDEHHDSHISIDISSLIGSDFAAAATLISFGALLGRVSPFQLLVLGILEMIFYNVSEKLGVLSFKAVDMGGSMFVHAFGAYFGLAASLAMGRGKYELFKDHQKNGSTKTTDMFAMVGTLFLFIFWPSFTGALAQQEQKYRVVVNTVLALAASCSASFSFTLLFRPERKFSMVDIQNATLAGGVAVGSACDLVIQPWGALLIGIAASLISVVGYTKISPFLERKIGLFDTCGVHNLHGMPGVLGGISGIFCALVADDSVYGSVGSVANIYPAREYRSAGDQALFQFLALVTTVAVASVSGYLVGLFLNLPVFAAVEVGKEYEDAPYWEIEKIEKVVEFADEDEALKEGEKMAESTV